MEEVSSFWSMKLGWMTFFCCMLASFTADLFNSSLEGFKLDGLFGLFQTDKYIVFKVPTFGLKFESLWKRSTCFAIVVHRQCLLKSTGVLVRSG
jgi:hypothetical protein